MKRIVLVISALMLVLLAGCSSTPSETQLVPDTRNGIFYTVFAEAQAEAQKSDKYILLDFWRPG